MVTKKMNSVVVSLAVVAGMLYATASTAAAKSSEEKHHLSKRTDRKGLDPATQAVSALKVSGSRQTSFVLKHPVR